MNMTKKFFILDTNVLLEDINAIDILTGNDNDNVIVIPYSVIVEMDRVKENNNKAHLVSSAIDKINSNEKIVFIKRDDLIYDKLSCKDESIIEDIKAFISFLKTNNIENVEPIVISNDKIFRKRIKIELGIQVQEYKSSSPFKTDVDLYTGYVRPNDEIISNCFVLNENKIWWEKTQDFIDENEIWKLKPRTVYQNMAMQLLLDDDIKVVSLASKSGYGKTALTLAAAIQLTQQKQNKNDCYVTEDGVTIDNITPDTNVRKKRKTKKDQEKEPNKYNKIYIVRPTTIIGEELGFLPGDLSEKIDPFFKPITELILKLHDLRPCNRLFNDNNPKNGFNNKNIEFIPITYLRGMNIENAIVIIDEIQNLKRSEVRTVLSRMGENVRCFLTGDPSQVDNKYLNESNNGLNWVVKKFKGYKEYAHITLKGPKSRGPISDLVIKSNL